VPEVMSAADAGKQICVHQGSLSGSSACRLKANKIYSVTHYWCVALITASHALSLNQSMTSQQEGGAEILGHHMFQSYECDCSFFFYNHLHRCPKIPSPRRYVKK